MPEVIRLLARGAHTGAALFGFTVMLLGGARPPLVLGFVALGILTVTVVDAWGLLWCSPLVALTVVFAAGGPESLGFLVVVGTGLTVLLRWLVRRRREAALAGRTS